MTGIKTYLAVLEISKVCFSMQVLSFKDLSHETLLFEA